MSWRPQPFRCNAHTSYRSMPWVNGKPSGVWEKVSVYCDLPPSHVVRKGTPHYCEERKHSWRDRGE